MVCKKLTQNQSVIAPILLGFVSDFSFKREANFANPFVFSISQPKTGVNLKSRIGNNSLSGLLF
jgi:hypothetical protein